MLTKNNKYRINKKNNHQKRRANKMTKVIEPKSRKEAISSRKYEDLISYISRDSVDYAEAIAFIKEAGKPGLLEKIKDQLKLKAEDLLKEKSPREKLEIAKKINSNFLWNIILQDKDVVDYVLSLDVLSAIQLAEKVEHIKFWELIQKNPKIAKCLR